MEYEFIMLSKNIIITDVFLTVASTDLQLALIMNSYNIMNNCLFFNNLF